MSASIQNSSQSGNQRPQSPANTRIASDNPTTKVNVRENKAISPDVAARIYIGSNHSVIANALKFLPIENREAATRSSKSILIGNMLTEYLGGQPPETLCNPKEVDAIHRDVAWATNVTPFYLTDFLPRLLTAQDIRSMTETTENPPHPEEIAALLSINRDIVKKTPPPYTEADLDKMALEKRDRLFEFYRNETRDKLANALKDLWLSSLEQASLVSEVTSSANKDHALVEQFFKKEFEKLKNEPFEQYYHRTSLLRRYVERAALHHKRSFLTESTSLPSQKQVRPLQELTSDLMTQIASLHAAVLFLDLNVQRYIGRPLTNEEEEKILENLFKNSDKIHRNWLYYLDQNVDEECRCKLGNRFFFNLLYDCKLITSRDRKGLEKISNSHWANFEVLNMASSLAESNSLSLQAYIAQLFSQTEFSEKTTLRSVILEEYSKTARKERDALLKEESEAEARKEKDRKRQQRISKEQVRENNSQQVPSKATRLETSKAKAEQQSSTISSSEGRGAKAKNTRDDDNDDDGPWTKVQGRHAQRAVRSHPQDREDLVQNFNLIKYANRIKRWLTADPESVRNFPDKNKNGEEIYKGKSVNDLILQILFHNPTPVLKLLQSKEFRDGYLKQTPRGFIALVEFSAQGMVSPPVKTFASIALSQDQDNHEYLYHFFIHPEPEIFRLDVDQSIMDIFYGNIPSREAMSSDTHDDDLSNSGKISITTQIGKGNGPSTLTVSYAIEDPLKKGRKIPCNLKFFEIRK
ncbi:MAG TPA: hypothetical protein VLE96_05670 [Chlamydiales bacterium]|nr:hypothetical protein [Chlamydiales bacterium]